MHEFVHKPRSCYTDNSAMQHSIKRFHSSHLGKPPGLSQQLSRSASNSSNSTSYSNEINKPPPPPPTKTKIAPMKEVEKLITDLKKENFDLKLRLYHLEDIMTKDLDLYQLNQQNRKLRMNLEDSSKHMEILQHELDMLLNKPAISIGIQTDPPVLMIDEEDDDDASVDSYFTALESPVIRKYQFNMDRQIESWLSHIDYTKCRGPEKRAPQI
ncbi:hypothetical protein HMPREF1544_04584 [Mucor circinelloides 1006PhL]|uniref:Centrosomin N-terminal motif 1 domain-containing protein n=1 Tax=Mucor circinelloides f. circinelloides (strain 1006PhL) TaxID=1220926 RepID=S2JE76_MUCC1|nr:hypothetical protein HMPREF1544_04584 [Mucor circinelloides 1006PhL]